MSTLTNEYSGALSEARALLAAHTNRDEALSALCRFLAERFPRYSWVGFYIVEPGTTELVLGPFVGEPTEHVRIPFGRGICGQAAERKETFVVQDVAQETNYLSCSPFVKSEIVIPVFADGAVAAELDIDSHLRGAFTPEDRAFLEAVAEAAAPLFAGRS